MVYAGRSVKRSTLTVTFILIRSIPEISTEVDTRAFIYFPLSIKLELTDRPLEFPSLAEAEYWLPPVKYCS